MEEGRNSLELDSTFDHPLMDITHRRQNVSISRQPCPGLLAAVGKGKENTPQPQRRETGVLDATVPPSAKLTVVEQQDFALLAGGDGYLRGAAKREESNTAAGLKQTNKKRNVCLPMTEDSDDVRNGQKLSSLPIVPATGGSDQARQRFTFSKLGKQVKRLIFKTD